MFTKSTNVKLHLILLLCVVGVAYFMYQLYNECKDLERELIISKKQIAFLTSKNEDTCLNNLSCPLNEKHEEAEEIIVDDDKNENDVESDISEEEINESDSESDSESEQENKEEIKNEVVQKEKPSDIGIEAFLVKSNDVEQSVNEIGSMSKNALSKQRLSDLK